MKLSELVQEDLARDADRIAIDDAVMELIRDEDDGDPLSDEELEKEILRLAKKYDLTPKQTDLLRLIADGPIGY